MTKSVLILGGNGRFGRHATQVFRRAGWNVCQFDRSTDDLRTAVQGMQVIVNAWNPPYPDWEAQVRNLHASVIEAAKTVCATVILPGNVYVYGPDNEAVWGPSTPHLARNPLGRVRIEMEQAYRDSGVRTILLRAGDFLDTSDSGNWFDMVITKSLPKSVLRYPGSIDVPHAWAFLPDLARAAVALAEMQDQLGQFEDLPFPGYTLSGKQMQELLSDVTGCELRLKRMNWAPMYLAAPVWKMARCLLEMRYLWNLPHALSPDRFRELLPDFVETSAEEALRQAVAWQFQDSGSDLATTSTQTSL